MTECLDFIDFINMGEDGMPPLPFYELAGIIGYYALR